MNRRGPWLVFVAAGLVLVGVMAWITGRLLDLERERVAAEQRSAHQELIRLALWRLDTEIAPLLSEEIAAVATLARAPEAADRVPRRPEIRARFVMPHGGAMEVLASADNEAEPALRSMFSVVDLWAAAPPLAAGRDDPLGLDNPTASPAWLGRKLSGSRPSSGSFFGSAQQRYRNAAELSNRVQAVDRNIATVQSSLANNQASNAALTGGAARPSFIDGELMVVRQVKVDDQTQLHGSWIEWSALRDRLQQELSDLLPQATLVATTAAPAEDDALHLLATLPVRLDPGPPPALDTDAWRALAPSLLLGWLGTLTAILAVFAVLRWSLALSERRAAFVSSVTHELRTPLTTFRMYAEMLEEGMVDEAKRGRYLSTLRREADRLGGLVENVLAYARIESDRAPLAPETLTVDALLGRMRERLEQRCAQAQLDLAVEVGPELAEAEVRTDPTATEQILFNLVDNAAKYAPSRRTPRVELGVATTGRGRLALRVRDFGPGIEPAEREAIFEPFAKASADASGTKPGVGLGLALCRRLARQLGGDLRVEPAEPGACFVLTLPRAS